MRARKEINLEEYNIQREKYSSKLNFLKNKKNNYLSVVKEDNFKDSMDNFYKEISDVIFSDDESIFRIFGSIIDTIYVEKIEEYDNMHKVMLYFKLSVLSHKNSDLNLNKFLLLFTNS